MGIFSKHGAKKLGRAKTFTGCWTCRGRKVKCDLRRPHCQRCEKSNLPCGGYDIKLRWSKPIQFDPYGVPIPQSSSATTTNLSGSVDEPQYQRRNIDFVRYEEEYVFHEDMDDELTMLHTPPIERISEDKTWILKKFGVFKGTDKVDKQYAPRKKRNRRKVAKNLENSGSNSSSSSPSSSTPSSLTQAKQTEEKPKNRGQIGTGLPSATDAVSPTPNLVDYDWNNLNITGYEWISSELRDDALLSAVTLQGHHLGHFQPLEVSLEENPRILGEEQQMGSKEHSRGIDPGNLNAVTSPEKETSANDKLYHQNLKLLFQKNPSNSEEPDPQALIDDIFVNIEPRSLPASDLNEVALAPPNDDSRMPKSMLEVTSLSYDLPSELIDIVPRSDLTVHGLARFLLNHYFNDVADKMTVVVLEKNPWKTLYFPRALMALGDLSGLGQSSNSRNALLNALLAVSCFHLQSKYPKNSKLQKYFLSLGIELRNQASNFLRLCLNTKSSIPEKYKDVLTAILSMNSIDVVWGTMADCQHHLAICEDFVESRMKLRPNISEKAKTLHRIFSFLKLIQDSTALDRVRAKEIVILPSEEDDQYKPLDTSTAAVTADATNIDVMQEGLFREALNENDGKIHIEFIKDSATNTSAESTPQSTTPPIFTNIATETYYNKSNISKLIPKGDEKIIGTDSLYGLPNSLILLFSDCVRIVRHNEYYNLTYLPVPRKFNELSLNFEKRLLKWKSEWKFYEDTPEGKSFINPTVEAIYHHTMSFYFSLIIYYFTMARSLNCQFLQNYVAKVLDHLNAMEELVNKKKVKIVPLIWQGFMAGCACTDEDRQQEFRRWAAKLAESGMGSYWGARQVMLEVWRRRKDDEPGDNWYSIYKDWEMNLMLS
ncbi:Arg81p [Saccharomyces eubayanus]|uniref:Arg81p n=1 Tax=Saccharomyces eubayanus TaxID=1080349 RepID=UPI0006C5757B|nr:ARG81-like protein [Saccharomyces eubayanus]KOG97256.1 ARG81-like protein [Saccharomyces eubayanus]